MSISYSGQPLPDEERNIFLSLMHQSIHPMSRALVKEAAFEKQPVDNCKETPGAGIEAWVNDRHYKVGNANFVQANPSVEINGARVYLSVDGEIRGYYIIANILRNNVGRLLSRLSRFPLTLLSGDNHSSFSVMRKVFPAQSKLVYNQTPQQKLEYVQLLQQQGNKVLMIGDGLNDAGALKQSDLGISVVEDVFSFTPACDAVMDVSKLWKLNRFIHAAKTAKLLITGLFIYSLLYNCIGLYYALSAQLQPMVAAILMPASSISVILFSFAGTKYIGKGIETAKTKHDHNHVKV
jgi:Cu+-exporting ATPase